MSPTHGRQGPSQPTPVLADGTVDSGAIGDALLKGLIAVQREQTFTGEMPSYQRVPETGLEYRQTVFNSTFVYDALGWFDPHSPWMEPLVLRAIPTAYRRKFVSTVRQIRKRIRAFIAWQEEANGLWRFYAHGSGIDGDSDTTSVAAMVLLEGTVGKLRQWKKHVDALQQFRGDAGHYYTYLNAQGRGYTWMGIRGEPIVGYDRVVNANVLRYLGYVGEEVSALVDYLWDEASGVEMLQGTVDYPNPLCFFYALARAWYQAQLPRREELCSLLLPPLLELQHDDGGFGGPLSTGLAMSAMLDLGHNGPEVARAVAWLLQHAEAHYGWGYEDFFVNGFGSTSWSTSLAMSVIARHSIRV